MLTSDTQNIENDVGFLVFGFSLGQHVIVCACSFFKGHCFRCLSWVDHFCLCWQVLIPVKKLGECGGCLGVYIMSIL